MHRNVLATSCNSVFSTTRVLVGSIKSAVAIGKTPMVIRLFPLAVLLTGCQDHETGPTILGVPAFDVTAQTPTPYACAELTPAEFTTLFVDAHSTGKRKGTPEDPFSSLSSALKFAEQRALSHVELQVAGGVYQEDRIRVTRELRIVGPGLEAEQPAELGVAIENIREHSLAIQGVVLTEHDGPHPAAVAVDNAAAKTAICDVRFNSVVGYALSQTGGALSMEDVWIQSTQASAGTNDFESGTAVRLSGGVDAVLRHLEVDGSAASGLIAEGAETRVYITGFDATGAAVRNNDGAIASHINGSAGCLGAVLVRDGALVLGEVLQFDENAMTGLNVLDGAQAHFRDFVASNTQQVLNNEQGGVCGFNTVSTVAIGSSATVELSGPPSPAAETRPGQPGFVLTNSDLAGLILRLPAMATASNGQVSDNPIGAVIRQPQEPLDDLGYDTFACLNQNVLYLNNQVNLDTDELGVPEPEQPLCTLFAEDDCPPPPPPVCAHVPFEPVWAQ
jgi:hypothetical protein